MLKYCLLDVAQLMSLYWRLGGKLNNSIKKPLALILSVFYAIMKEAKTD